MILTPLDMVIRKVADRTKSEVEVLVMAKEKVV